MFFFGEGFFFVHRVPHPMCVFPFQQMGIQWEPTVALAPCVTSNAVALSLLVETAIGPVAPQRSSIIAARKQDSKLRQNGGLASTKASVKPERLLQRPGAWGRFTTPES